MEEAGVVKGSTLAINHEELGFQMGAFLGIDLIRDELLDEVITQLKEIPQILTAYYTSGPHPILARIICVDKNDLSEILRTQVYPIAGIQRVEAYITLSEYFNRSVQIHDAVE
jgi:Lrp/AsnC family transcriptional regulator for asnA, asnC and gidA